MRRQTFKERLNTGSPLRSRLCGPVRWMIRDPHPGLSCVRSRTTRSVSFFSKQILSFHAGVFALILCVFVGCGGGGSDAPAPVTPSADSFKFVVITDVHVRLPGNPDDAVYNNAGNLNQFSGALDLITSSHTDADLIIVNGDLVGCLFSSNPEDYFIGTDNPAETFKTMMQALGKPSYAALGNHDYQDGFNVSLREGVTATDPAAMEAVWKKVLGIDPYYSFIHKGVRFIILNSTRGPSYNEICPAATAESGCKGSFDDAQMDWLEVELAKPEFCLLFMHHPPITDNNSFKNWSAGGLAMQVRSGDRFYAIARANKTRIKGIFVGHGHRKEKDTLEATIPVHETGSIGDYQGSSRNIRVVWMDPFTGVMLTD